MTDVVLAYETVGVYADPDVIDPDALGRQLEGIEPVAAAAPAEATVTIPVLYDGEDLSPVAARLGLTEDAVIAAHSGRTYRVFALGFRPGFPYAGYLPRELTGLERRSQPRSRVPAGSVAIVGRQTAVYPEVSPGGWHLLGRTPLRIADVATGHFPIRAGDRLTFVPVDADTFAARRGEPLERA